jgi:hypothetical protein
MADITFLKLHFEDTAFNATKGEAPASGDEVTFEADPTGDEEAGGGPGLGAVVAVFVGLAFLLAVAYVAKGRFLDDEEDEFGGYEDYEG